MKPALIAIVDLSLVALDARRSSQDRAQARDFQIVVGTRFGPVQESTTHAGLAARFGRVAILDTDISIGEGFCAPGTRVFVGMPDEIEGQVAASGRPFDIHRGALVRFDGGRIAQIVWFMNRRELATAVGQWPLRPR
jgi:hypothetical protein